MLILAVESSCDETATAVVKFESDNNDNHEITVLGEVVASQIETHALYGGVVPEIASRAHTESLTKITLEALDMAKVTMADIDAVAVTYAPGLIGALLTGVNFAKGLAFANNKPLIPVHHIKGHISASYLTNPDLKPPFLALAASGGHTSIIDVKSRTEFKTIGFTRDDAVGECFDKVARVMGISYPGGKEMDKLASLGNKNAYKFPSAAIPDDSLEFSFSGLKTAVINHIHNCSQKGEEINKEDIASCLTKSITDSVVSKLSLALDKTGYDKLAVAGGVAANSHLRNALKQLAESKNITLVIPPVKYCGDNAVMIAIQGYFEYLNGTLADTSLNAKARV